MKSSDTNVNSVLINFSFPSKEQKQSDLFEVIDIMMLETNDSSLIGDVTTIIPKPSGVYILDRWSGKRVVKFDTLGNFLFSINNQGRGVGEFLSIYEIGVDANDQFLYLYDPKRQSVHCYNATNGNYIRSFPFYYNAGSFGVLPDGKHFMFYCNFLPNKDLEKDNKYPNFIITDSVGSIKETFDYFDKKIHSENIVYIGSVFASFDSTFCYFSQYQDVIFQMRSNQTRDTAYVLDYMNDNQTKSNELLRRIIQYNNLDFKRNQMERKSRGIYELFKFCFTEETVYFMGDYCGKIYNFLYDKKQSQAIDLASLKKNVVGDDLYFRTADREYFYVVVPAVILKKSVVENREYYDPKIVHVAEGLEEDANPVVIKLKMKDM